MSKKSFFDRLNEIEQKIRANGPMTREKFKELQAKNRELVKEHTDKANEDIARRTEALNRRPPKLQGEPVEHMNTGIWQIGPNEPLPPDLQNWHDTQRHQPQAPSRDRLDEIDMYAEAQAKYPRVAESLRGVGKNTNFGEKAEMRDRYRKYLDIVRQEEAEKEDAVERLLRGGKK